MTKGEKVLNALTIVGYVFVGLFVFVAIYLSIAYAAGYFNPQKQPVVGLKFTTSEQIVISENGGKATLCIVSSDAVISTDDDGNLVIDDPATPTEVRLTVRNVYDGAIDNSIISVPSTVMTGDPFEITALINELDGFDSNVGGDCFIYAETADGLYRALPISVFVDVPVKEIELSAVNPLNNQPIDLTTADFIWGDQIQFIANVYPKRALNPHTNGTAAENKKIEFSSGVTSSVAPVGDLYSGLFTVEYRGDSNVITSDEEITDPQLVTITAQMMSTYGAQANDIIAECQLRLFPLQLHEIIIQNPDFSDSADSINLDLIFDNQTPVRFSATDTGDSSIINLDIFLEPVRYNADNNSNPLSYLLSNLNMIAKSSLTDFPENALDINSVLVNGVPVWTVTPLRTLEPNEEVSIEIGFRNDPNSTTLIKSIERVVEIDYTTPENLQFLDENGAVVNEITLQIAKEGDEVIPWAEATPNYQLKYQYSNTTTPTFTKVVYFVNNDNKYNETGSLIIDVNDVGEILKTNGLDFVRALGAGTIQITPYVVRTNKDGVPVDRNYNPIAEGAALGIRTITKGSTEPITDAGYYVAYTDNEYAPITINVEELLISLTVYTDEEMTQELTDENNSSVNPLRIGTLMLNEKVLYAKPNSPLALPKDKREYTQWATKFGNIVFRTNYQGESGSGALIVPGDISDSNVSFKETTGEDGSYQRYFTFSVYTTNAFEVQGIVSIFLEPDNQIGSSLSKQIHISAENIHVADINIDTSNSQILDSVGIYNNTKYWELFLNISDTTNVYNNKNYLRLYWTQSDSSAIVLPGVEYLASEEWATAGFRPSVGIDGPIINFYAFDYTEKYNLSDTDSQFQNLDIRDIINLKLDTAIPEYAEIYAKKWEILNSLMQSTEANKYAKVENVNLGGSGTVSTSTIQFLDELPANYCLFMVYSVDDTDSTAEPDFVRIEYNFPSVHFFDYDLVYGNTNDAGDIVITQEENSLYFQQANFLLALCYDPMSVSYTDDVYDPATDVVSDSSFKRINSDIINTYNGNYSNCFESPNNSKDYFEFDMANRLPTEEEETTSGNYWTISLDTEAFRIQAAEEDSTYTLTANRSINFVFDVRWTDDLWANPDSLGQFDLLDSYFQQTKNVSSVYTINIIVEKGQIVTATS